MHSQWKNGMNFLLRGAFLLTTLTVTSLYACQSNRAGLETDANTTDTTTLDPDPTGRSNSPSTPTGKDIDTIVPGNTDTVGTGTKLKP
ncbi:MAG: hypothetical protein AVDCRST_MAG56-140 [uncultured Cytophagales bacterium]|uniref:Uncharacterized protein n=1 Tax=uncultured Cytophagales bacterium TaxID=158755 RepID=A0A6J4H716_9SPHI|nr:MAG: hypothetical protein AVDCRST_MAG56-140 [uncultured Cytophagales bacterium]